LRGRFAARPFQASRCEDGGGRAGGGDTLTYAMSCGVRDGPRGARACSEALRHFFATGVRGRRDPDPLSAPVSRPRRHELPTRTDPSAAHGACGDHPHRCGGPEADISARLIGATPQRVAAQIDTSTEVTFSVLPAGSATRRSSTSRPFGRLNAVLRRRPPEEGAPVGRVTSRFSVTIARTAIA